MGVKPRAQAQVERDDPHPVALTRKPTSPFKGRCSDNQSSFALASLSALPMTLTEDSAIAAAPIIGDSKMPNTG